MSTLSSILPIVKDHSTAFGALDFLLSYLSTTSPNDISGKQMSKWLSSIKSLMHSNTPQVRFTGCVLLKHSLVLCSPEVLSTHISGWIAHVTSCISFPNSLVASAAISLLTALHKAIISSALPNKLFSESLSPSVSSSILSTLKACPSSALFKSLSILVTQIPTFFNLSHTNRIIESLTLMIPSHNPQELALLMSRFVDVKTIDSLLLNCLHSLSSLFHVYVSPSFDLKPESSRFLPSDSPPSFIEAISFTLFNFELIKTLCKSGLAVDYASILDLIGLLFRELAVKSDFDPFSLILINESLVF
ncbi:hypothetical protein GEMRC1_005639 [Eukaryota sp. GEM-RC1]